MSVRDYDLRQAWQQEQGRRCGCRGTDDYCPCQNVVQAPFPSPGYRVGHDNREAVRAYFLSHVGCTNVECASALGLSVMTVGRHVKTLRQEWANRSPSPTGQGANL